TGLTALGNGQGMHIVGSNNTIGGTTPGARNVISGNNNPAGGTGVNIEAFGVGGAQYNIMQGNYIGTDITGTIGLGLQTGIAIGGGAYNTIGGTAAAARNIISGNIGGIVLTNGGGSFGNVIQGNYIGTDPSGTQVVGQGHAGIVLQGGNHDNI